MRQHPTELLEMDNKVLVKVRRSVSPDGPTVVCLSFTAEPHCKQNDTKQIIFLKEQSYTDDMNYTLGLFPFLALDTAEQIRDYITENSLHLGVMIQRAHYPQRGHLSWVVWQHWKNGITFTVAHGENSW